MLCDRQAFTAVTNYQSHFGSFATASDGARHHCSIFENLWKCYADCLNGSSDVYNSETKTLFDQLYMDNCDPACRTAVLPWCYLEAVGAHDITKSCNGSTLDSNLKACMEAELFTKQNCSGSCTRGQRKAMFSFFKATSECIIPRDREYECSQAARDCSEEVFGYQGSVFITYSNLTLMESNLLACSVFGDNYGRCMQRALSGDDTVELEPADNDTRSPPCAGLGTDVQFLQYYARSKLVTQLCNAPMQSFTDICYAYIAASPPLSATTPPAADPNISSDPATLVTTNALTLPTTGWSTSSKTYSPTSPSTDFLTSPKTSTTSQSTVRDNDWMASSAITSKPYSATTADTINGVTTVWSLLGAVQSATFAACATWFYLVFTK